MSSIAPAASLPRPGEERQHEFRSGSLVIREKTVTIGNSIYPVQNISTVSVADLSTTKPLHPVTGMCLAVGLVLSAFGSGIVRMLGLLLLAGSGFFLYQHWQSRNVARFILTIRMNAGNVAGVLSDNVAFLKTIALELFEVIERDVPRNVTFNLDRSVAIDNVSGSAIAIGSVSGDLVNTVQGL